MKHWRTFAVLVVASASLGACSGSDASNVDGGDDATTAGDVAVDASDGGVLDGAPLDDASLDAAVDDSSVVCGDAGCRACCRDTHPAAAMTLRADERTCGCSMPGECEAGPLCGNDLCANQKETPECVACLADPDAGDCTQKALAKCAAKPACAALEACIAACGDGG